jgi:hypothetical protein
VVLVLDPEVLGQHLDLEQRLMGLDIEQLTSDLCVNDAAMGCFQSLPCSMPVVPTRPPRWRSSFSRSP